MRILNGPYMRAGIATLLVFGILPMEVQAQEPQFNNGSADDYRRAASLSGDARAIQAETKGLWPRVGEGSEYSIKPNSVTITEDDSYIKIKTNNLPDHTLTTTNPNCAKVQSYTFKIPKNPKRLDSPRKITKSMQEIGVALNGVVIAGPFDSQNKIAPYNRIVDQCASHADPEGMYHYHFAPLCIKDAAGEEIGLKNDRQIGWSFDGYKILGLADRREHKPEIDICNGHEHDGEYHYHATRDFPFFMGCYAAKPYAQNFSQKKRTQRNPGSGGPGSSRSSCPSDMKRSGGSRGGPGGGKGGRPNFEKAVKVLGVSKQDIKRALGPPPGDFERAAKQLGISEAELRDALDKN